MLIGHGLRPAVLAHDEVLARRRYLAQLQRSLQHWEGEDDRVALHSEYLHLRGPEEAPVRWRDGAALQHFRRRTANVETVVPKKKEENHSPLVGKEGSRGIP